ncbi:MAG: M56 family metallopeptidase, partial [Actinomycetota bacterium]
MPGDGSGGLFLLLTESFAVRALLGSMVAIGLVFLAVRVGNVRTGRARRMLVLAPITAAVAAAVVSVGDAFLPRLWVATTQGSSAMQLLQFLGEPWFLTPQRDVDLLLVAWAGIALVLLARRLAGLLAVRIIVARARPPSGYGDLVPVVDRLAHRTGIRPPELRLLPRCPGGAFTARVLRPVLVVDPVVVDGLDQRELEGLLAHELAHIRRRDNLLAGVIGVVRDLTFFLPPVHAAARWLRHEREESADELASEVTRRPGALASSILKVWESSSASRHRLACAAVPSRLALAGGGAMIESRIERLITVADILPLWRRRAELAIAGVVTATAV